jgi:hypothetical protein
MNNVFHPRFYVGGFSLQKFFQKSLTAERDSDNIGAVK